jgi:hypothetical protein
MVYDEDGGECLDLRPPVNGRFSTSRRRRSGPEYSA